jgi:hypothetical protein
MVWFPEIIGMVKEFQSLIVGVIGFTGVIATLLTNALLARRQHAGQVRHESDVLRAALIAELQLIREAFMDRIAAINGAENRAGMLVPLDSLSDVYESLIDRIGLLSEPETRAVVRAYVLVRQLPGRIKLLNREHATDVERELGWAYVEGPLFGALKILHENYLRDIDAALVELGRHRA